MRFLVDECTGPTVAKWLRSEGHEVFSIYEQARGLTDAAVLSKALSENWILVTNDKDFGEMIFRERRVHKGVVFLRLADERAANKIDVLRKLIASHGDRLAGKFVTVTETRIRLT